MSTKKPQPRSHMLGCNIRPGHTPGDFSRPFVRKRKMPSVEKVKEAAQTALVKMGFVEPPSAFQRALELQK